MSEGDESGFGFDDADENFDDPPDNHPFIPAPSSPVRSAEEPKVATPQRPTLAVKDEPIKRKPSKTEVARPKSLDDDLGDLAETMGADFGFGYKQEDSDPNVKPITPPLLEVISAREHDSVQFVWKPLGQHVHTLFLQCMPIKKGKGGFSSGFDGSEKAGGLKVKIENPLKASKGGINRLQPESDYVFRLVATNGAGYCDGPVTPIITTIPYAPLQGDKSGWLMKLKDSTADKGKNTLSRRLSLTSFKPSRFWFVLEGALLSWYKTVDGKEEGFVHLGKLKEISWTSGADTIAFELFFNDEKTSLELECRSDRPSVTDKEYFTSWVQALSSVRAKVGNAVPVHKTSA